MDLNGSQPSLLLDGYEIISADSSSSLDSIREFISNLLVKKYSLTVSDPSNVLNNIHKYAEISSDASANSLVLDVINSSKNQHDFSTAVYQAFGSTIRSFLGPDLHAQRNNNIVFQYPNSHRFSELHTDYPPNSPYELVLWVPLVDCFDTKSFYIVPLPDSTSLISAYSQNKYPSWDLFKSDCLLKAKHLQVDYGNAIIFWTGLIHGSLTNETTESRWCINVRFKNLFAPCGQHDPLTYYKVFNTSPVTKIALSLS